MAKFNRKSLNLYEKPHLNNSSIKRKAPSLNTRYIQNYDDIFQGVSSERDSRLLKVFCVTQNPDCWQDLINELQAIIVRYSNDRCELKPVNALYRDNKLEFYLQISKATMRIICNNYRQITKYSIKCNEYSEMHVPSVFPENWLLFIKESLKTRFITEPNGRCVLDLSNFFKDKYLNAQNLILKLSLPKVLENIVNLIKPELSVLSKLDLSQNSISNIYKLKPLLNSIKLDTLDISKNRLRDLLDLDVLKGSSIIELNIVDNDIVRRMKFTQLRDGIRKYLPKLQILNGKKLEETVLIAGETTVINLTKELPQSIRLNNQDTEVFQFFLRFVNKHDMKTRDELCDFYSTESCFTMSSFGDIPFFYRNFSNNYQLLRDPQKRRNNIKRGKVQIMGVLAEFPPTKHMPHTFDIQVVACGNNFMTFQVTGVFIELPYGKTSGYRPRHFARWMVVIPGEIIIQDHVDITPNDHHLLQKYKEEVDQVRRNVEFHKKHSSNLDSGMPLDQVDIIRQFKEISGMKIYACLELLKASSNLDDAKIRFQTMRTAGQIAPELFGSD